MEKKRGAPKRALDLPEGWQGEIINLYSEGASDVEIKAWIYKATGKFSNDLWERWIEEETDFAETIKRGRSLSHAWWEKMGRENLMFHPKSTQMSYVGWYMNMKNRFGWTDTQKVEHSGNPERPVLIINAGKDPYAGPK